MKHGSPQLENGYVKIANELLEALMNIYLSNYERRMLDCIIRYTYGFQKKTSKLSLSFIAKATSIPLPHISRTKKKLLQRNMVTQIGNNEIGLQKKYKEWVTQIGNLPKQVTKVTQIGNKKLPKQGGNKYNIKKTIKENISRKQKFACPLGTENHKKCIAFLEDLAKQKNLPHGWINMGKQIGFLHKLLRFKYTFEQIKQEAIELDQSNFMWDKWDLSTIANQIEKKGREVIVDGTSS